MGDPTFSIIVPTFGRPDALRVSLSALLTVEYDSSRYEVIVVDDGADAITAEIINGLSPHGVQITLETQLRRGAAHARNRGARAASGELLLFCDDDILVEPTHLRKHLAVRDHHGDSAVNGTWQFAPTVMAKLRSTPFGRYRIQLEHRFQEEALGEPVGGDRGCFRMPLVGSWDLALRRELFWDIGGFDEDFPGAGAEDQDFSIRARCAGIVLLLDTKIRCLHNDNRLSIQAYCAREERSAQTMPFLARKYPTEFGEVPYVRENRPITRGDRPTLAAKKLIKAALAHDAVLLSLHRLTGVLEALRVPDRFLGRLYKVLLGLHLFRGFRRTWRR